MKNFLWVIEYNCSLKSTKPLWNPLLTDADWIRGDAVEAIKNRAKLMGTPRKNYRIRKYMAEG
jgi:hypothetical protein